jgi:hypothetical protein
MAAFYFDSSATVKRYDPREADAQWVRSLFNNPSRDLYLFSQLASVEVASAFYRKWREGIFDDAELTLVLDSFHQDTLPEYWLEPISASIIELAVDLIKRHPLRAYDAVQLATAISLNTDLQVSGVTVLFLSADDRLIQAALSEGLQADNPNRH